MLRSVWHVFGDFHFVKSTLLPEAMGLSDAQLGFVLVCAAGSATGLGAAVVFSERLVQMASKRFLASALGVSAGVMLYVSFVEIFVKSQQAFEATASLGPSDAYFAASGALFAGILLMGALDKVVHALDPRHQASHSSDPGQYMADHVEQEQVAGL
jgi:zinc transporter ZupT